MPAAHAASTDNQQIKAEAVERANALFGKLEFFDPEAARKPASFKVQPKPSTKAAKAVAQAAAVKGAPESVLDVAVEVATPEGTRPMTQADRESWHWRECRPWHPNAPGAASI